MRRQAWTLSQEPTSALRWPNQNADSGHSMGNVVRDLQIPQIGTQQIAREKWSACRGKPRISDAHWWAQAHEPAAAKRERRLRRRSQGAQGKVRKRNQTHQTGVWDCSTWYKARLRRANRASRGTDEHGDKCLYSDQRQDAEWKHGANRQAAAVCHDPAHSKVPFLIYREAWT